MKSSNEGIIIKIIIIIIIIIITGIRKDTNNTIDDRMTVTRKQKWERNTTL